MGGDRDNARGDVEGCVAPEMCGSPLATFAGWWVALVYLLSLLLVVRRAERRGQQEGDGCYEEGSDAALFWGGREICCWARVVLASISSAYVAVG